MDLRNRLAFVGTFALVIAAGALFSLATPEIAAAEFCDGSECTYAGECYSSGACVQATCPPNQSQKCISNDWSGCGIC